MEIRQKYFKEKRKFLATNTSIFFTNHLSRRGYSGYISFDHSRETLNLIVSSVVVLATVSLLRRFSLGSSRNLSVLRGGGRLRDEAKECLPRKLRFWGNILYCQKQQGKGTKNQSPFFYPTFKSPFPRLLQQEKVLFYYRSLPLLPSLFSVKRKTPS